MSKRSVLIGMGLLAGFFSNSAQAQSSNVNGQDLNTITTGVPFLRISPDARSGAMGDVGVATSPDANAQYWNIGKMPFNEKTYGISLTYTPWLQDLVPDVFLAYLAGYAKFGDNKEQAISASLRYFSLGDINYKDINAVDLGQGKPREMAFDIGYSRKLSDYLSAGISLRYINSSLLTGAGTQNVTDYKPGNAFGADLGLYYHKKQEIDEYRSNDFSAGIVFSNLGSKISYSSQRSDYLPMNLGIGAAYGISLDEYNKLTLALDLNKLLAPTPIRVSNNDSNNTYHYEIPNKPVVGAIFGSFGDAPGGFNEEMREIQISLGAEYWYQNQFAVRLGYFYEDKTKGNRKYFTAGVGVRYSMFTLNAAYLIPSGSGITRNPLSNTLRFSLLFDFDKIGEKVSINPTNG